MLKIRLEGVAGKRFGYEHHLNVRNPNEAIRALCQLIPGFKTFLSSAHEFGVYFQIISRGEAIGYDHLAFGTSEIVLVPVISGAFFKNFFSGIGAILLGVALVAFAMTGFGLVTFGAATTLSGAIQTAIMGLGFGLIFTGVAGLFAPGVPETDVRTEGKPADDAITNAGTGTAADGTPVPVVYGETLVTNIPVVSSYIKDGADTSEARAFWMGVLSEGLIEGFPNNQQEDIFFNGLKGTAAGVDQVEFVRGGQTTDEIKLLKNQGFHMSIGTTFPVAGGEYGNRVPESADPNTEEIRSFNQPYADKIRLRFIQGVTYQTKNNSRKSGSVTFSYIDYDKSDDNSGGADNPLRWVVQVFAAGNLIYDEVFPKKYENKNLINRLTVHEFDVSGQPQPISVKVVRVDRANAREVYNKRGESGTRSYNWVKGDLTWLSMEVLWNEKLVYPETALLACSFKAGSVTRLPAISAKIKGRLLPTLDRNLNISYRYSDNPANVVLDLLTNPRYGAGQRTFTTNAPLNQEVFQPGIRWEDIDKASFRKAQKYCNKHNITFNATIAGDADTLELLRSITATFQGQLIYAGGYISVVIDDQVEGNDFEQYRLFTQANVIQDRSGDSAAPCFVYEGTGKKARTTAVQVSYIDATNFYKEAKTLVEDRDAMQKYGYNLKKIRALGCTNREQAERMGRYTLATNLRSTETVSFKVGPEGALLLPGDVCLIGDPLKTRITAGGRIDLASSNTITTDRELTSTLNLSPGKWYVYTYTSAGIVQRNQVQAISGSTITISGSFGSVPSSSMLWVLVDEGPSNNQGMQFNRYRVQKVTENNDGTFSIIGIKYDHAKYDFVNTGVASYGGARTLRYSTNTAIDSSSINFRLRTTNP